jgi:hypothetical protein
MPNSALIQGRNLPRARPHAGRSPPALRLVSIETRDAAMIAVQEAAAQATDQISKIMIAAAFALVIITTIQAVALLAWF